MKKGSIFIMKKIYKIEDLDCANCAAKIEKAISELDGVENAAVSFLSQKITLEVKDEKIKEIEKAIVKICKRIEPDCTVII